MLMLLKFAQRKIGPIHTPVSISYVTSLVTKRHTTLSSASHSTTTNCLATSHEQISFCFDFFSSSWGRKGCFEVLTTNSQFFFYPQALTSSNWMLSKRHCVCVCVCVCACACVESRSEKWRPAREGIKPVSCQRLLPCLFNCSFSMFTNMLYVFTTIDIFCFSSMFQMLIL